MAIALDDFTRQLKEQIQHFKAPTKMVDVGTVMEVGDGIARISGLQNVMLSELVEFKDGTLGIALNLDEDSVGTIIMGEYSGIQEGDVVRSTGRIASVPVGEAMIGRVVNAIGQPIDGKGPIESTVPVLSRALRRTSSFANRSTHPSKPASKPSMP